MYHVYVLYHEMGKRSYVGITTDPERRLRQHNGLLSGGAKCTRRLGPGWELKGISPDQWPDRSSALKNERRVKRKRGLESRLRELLLPTLPEAFRNLDFAK